MIGAQFSQTELARIVEQDRDDAEDEEESDLVTNGGGTARNDANAIENQRAEHPRRRRRVRLISSGLSLMHWWYYGLLGLLAALAGKGGKSCGKGEQGRRNAAVVCSLLLVPFLLLIYFVMDDYEQSVARTSSSWIETSNMGLDQLDDYIGVDDHDSTTKVRDLSFKRANFRAGKVLAPAAWRLPRRSNGPFPLCPRGVLFLFHECNRKYASFFYGPQGRVIISKALDAGLAVVSFSRTNEVGCWIANNDLEPAKVVTSGWIKNILTPKCAMGDNGEPILPPIYGFGVSSGGLFVATLAADLENDDNPPFKFAALNIQIMAPWGGLRWAAPTLFTLMAGDEETKARADELTSAEFPSHLVTAEVMVTSGKKPIHMDHFAKVFADDPQMNDFVSKEIYSDLVSMGIIDASNDMLTMNPDLNDGMIKSVLPLHSAHEQEDPEHLGKHEYPYGVSKNLISRLHPQELADANRVWLTEELRCAWDRHEITSEGFDNVLKFFFDNDGGYRHNGKI